MQDKIIINGVEYTILVKFTSASTEKDYVIYSTLEPKDHIIDIYSGVFNDGKIESVQTEEEQKIIEKMITTLSAKANEKYNLIK